MNLQHDRIRQACAILKLNTLASEWSAVADRCAGKDGSLADFLDCLLEMELSERRDRTRETLHKFAGFPRRKLLEDYGFKFASGAPRKLLTKLGGLAFVERGEHVALIV